MAKHKAEIDALRKRRVKGAEFEAALAKMGAGELPKTPFTVVVDHIEHIAKVAGVDHVGLGSDFDGVPALPEGLSGMDGLPRITLELLRRGFADEDVKKILGENFLRAMSQAEAYASATKTTLSGDGAVVAIEKEETSGAGGSKKPSPHGP